jgi:hypothetical protein
MKPIMLIEVCGATFAPGKVSGGLSSLMQLCPEFTTGCLCRDCLTNKLDLQATLAGTMSWRASTPRGWLNILNSWLKLCLGPSAKFAELWMHHWYSRFTKSPH